MKSSSLVGLAITAMFLTMYYLTQGPAWALFGLIAGVITLVSSL
jgi:hypothetical protein